MDVAKVGELLQKLAPYKLPLILGLGSLLFLVGSLIYLIQTSQSHDDIEFVMGEATESADVAQSKIVIDVSGGVEHPGVYNLPQGSRIEDAIKEAGGLSQQADDALIQKSVNRAAKLNDGAKLYIPVKQDGGASNASNTSSNMNSITSHNIISTNGGRGLISINSASQETLESLSGVGPVTASKIIAGRPYMSLDELTAKKIVGKKVFEQIQAQISL